jgi:UDP-N-acetylglucosamine:LPS N-acetylglucosamine transferase
MENVEVVGSRRGLDAGLLADAGVAVTLLPGRGIVRRMTPKAIIRNLAAVTALIWATGRSVALVASRRPAVVVAVGGYASVPPALAAAVLRVPVVVVNVDAVPGAANRLLGRISRACAVAFSGTPLPRAEVTGVPVRAEIVAVDRSPESKVAARRELGLPEDEGVVGAFGGSLGARKVNEAVIELADRWSGRRDRSIYHVVGRRDSSWAAGRAPASGAPVYRQVAYEERMDLLYAAADVVVCRAGANTVAELTVIGLPAVLVPLPGAPGDHQTANARVLERVGAAVILPDGECTGDRLADLLDDLLSDPVGLEARGKAAKSLGHPDAADAVAALADRCARVDGRRRG